MMYHTDHISVIYNLSFIAIGELPHIYDQCPCICSRYNMCWTCSLPADSSRSNPWLSLDTMMTPVIGSSTNDEFLKPNTAVYRTLPNSPVSGSTASTVVTRTPAVAFSGSWMSYSALVNRGALSLTSSKYTTTDALAKVWVRFLSPPPPGTDSSVANTYVTLAMIIEKIILSSLFRDKPFSCHRNIRFVVLL